jgi:PAS domain-containing protein
MAMPITGRHTGETAFASARRDSIETVRVQRAAFLAEPMAIAMLDAMPGPAFVLNLRRQIVAANRMLSEMPGLANPEDVLGMRPGEAVHCTHATERVNGCGTASSCAQCGALLAVLECIETRKRTVRECRIVTSGEADGGALDLRVHASYLSCGAEDYVVVGLQDIRDQKRREVLERTFFRDLLGTARDVHGIAETLLRPDLASVTTPDRREALEHLSGLVVEQIESQRALLAAEGGELRAEPADVDLAQLLSETVAALRHQDVGAGRTIRFESVRRCPLETDPVLFRRAVTGLLRNALEATPPGGTVDVTCEYEQEVATLSVHNDGVIPEDVQAQIFQRSFSTRGEDGRGIGTYSARLLVEHYLKGKVAFISEPRVGTLFVIMLPRRMGARPAG